MGRNDLRSAAVFLGALSAMLAALLISLVTAPWPTGKADDGFLHDPHDRAMLETAEQVSEAVETSFSRFKFDGVYYIIYNMPGGYVEYSEWAGR